MWKFKDSVSAEQKEKLRAELPGDFAALVDKVPSLKAVKFVSCPLSSSTHDMALMTEHDDAAGLAAYSGHPEHQALANAKVRPFTTERAALDYDD
jgi:hypothetical protein